jgi:hypothetical protein
MDIAYVGVLLRHVLIRINFPLGLRGSFPAIEIYTRALEEDVLTLVRNAHLPSGCSTQAAGTCTMYICIDPLLCK